MPRPQRGDPTPVGATLSEWTIRLSEATIPAGPVTFTVTNSGSIPHAFEVEGHGTEQETALIQPGASATLTLTLEPGSYEIYCPVGEDSHKKLGMDDPSEVSASACRRGPPVTGAGRPRDRRRPGTEAADAATRLWRPNRSG